MALRVGFIFRRASRHQTQQQLQLQQQQQQHRTNFTDAAATTTFVRDRGLDHVVEKEKNLKPLINLKTFLKSEPSKSLPVSVIAQNRQTLQIPIRPIDFLRKYPSVFEEFLPGNVAIHPHFKLTKEVLELDSEEQLICQSETYRNEAADRVLKLLMLCKGLKIPLGLLDVLKWDMGLPQDFEKSVVPEFPDYFRVVGSDQDGVLELVCWSSELAESVMERRAKNAGGDYSKGMAIEFTLHFPKDFEMDKKVRKWVDEWRKLPYISPYNNMSHLPPKSDESDKWVVGVLHELLHLFISKKTDKETLLYVGEYLGVRSRFKRALSQHPGIFYVSSKNRTHTVLLKEAFKRGSLIEEHPLMLMRNRYIHLMNMVNQEKKMVGRSISSTRQDKVGAGDLENGGENGSGEGKELNDDPDTGYEDGNYGSEDSEDDRHAGAWKVGSTRRKLSTEKHQLTRQPARKLAGEEISWKHEERSSRNSSRRKGMSRGAAFGKKPLGRLSVPASKG